MDADVPAALESMENPLGTNAAGTAASTLASEPVQEMVPAPAVVEAEAPPVVTPEPVAEVPTPVIDCCPAPYLPLLRGGVLIGDFP